MFNDWIAFIQQGSEYSLGIGFLIMIILAFIPAVPIPFFAGIMAATFGFWPALLMNWGGATIGAILMFLVTRFLFQKRALRYLHRHEKTDYVLTFIKENAFLSILIVRLLPIFPSVLINLVAAVSGISSRTFIIATALGKLPAMITFTLAGSQVQSRFWDTVILIGLYGIIIVLLAKKVRERIRTRSKI
jgi:uncharacterized membrane protein YdjX (TVP38/TMEM64 family)